MTKVLRVRVELYDPPELSLDLPEPEVATLLGELDTANLTPKRAEICTDPASRLSGLEIERIVVGPRHVGDSLMALQQGQSVIVMGSAITAKDAKPMNFIGEVFPLHD